MALFTIPAVSKGSAATIQLDKTELFALTAVIADAYFSVQANVDKVIVEFNSDPGNQKELLKFDIADAAPEASFQVSALARDSFLLERIILTDFDGGMLVIERSQLPSGFDITLGGGGGGGGGGSELGGYLSGSPSGSTPYMIYDTAGQEFIFGAGSNTIYFTPNPIGVDGNVVQLSGETRGTFIYSLDPSQTITLERWTQNSQSEGTFGQLEVLPPMSKASFESIFGSGTGAAVGDYLYRGGVRDNLDRQAGYAFRIVSVSA